MLYRQAEVPGSGKLGFLKHRVCSFVSLFHRAVGRCLHWGLGKGDKTVHVSLRGPFLLGVSEESHEGTNSRTTLPRRTVFGTF